MDTRLLRSAFRWIPSFILLIPAAVFCRANNIFFERLAIEQGLSHASFYAIFQDSKGFIWFGTPAGLIRYDGYTYKTYDRTPLWLWGTIYEDKHGSLWSTGDGQILKLDLSTEHVSHFKFGTGHLAWREFQEAGGDLWVGSNGDGLGRYVRSENQFHRYAHDPANPGSICNDTVLATLVDRHGNLWLGTRRGLDRLDSRRGEFVHCDQLRRNAVASILEDQDWGLWVGTEDGLCRYDESRGIFERFRDSSQHGEIFWSLFLDSRNELWISTSNHFARFDRSARRFSIADQAHRIPANFYLLHPMHEDQQGNIWAVGEDGLAVLDRGKETLELIPSNPQDPRTLPEQSQITALLEDRTGGLWIGMQSGGVCLLDRNRVPFIQIGQNQYDSLRLSQPYVSAILEDSTGTLWVGTHRGLDRLDPSTGVRTHYGDRSGKPGRLHDSRIYQIIEDGSNTLWLAGDALYRMNKTTSSFDVFYPHPEPEAPSNEITSLCIDKSGNLLLGGGLANGHLDLFDRATQKITRDYFLAYDSTRAGENVNPINAIQEEPSGLLWFVAGGLCSFDRSSGQARFYVSHSDSAGSLSGLAQALCEDVSGTLWIGTSAGLDRLDRRSNLFLHFTEKDGLASSNILGILEDNSGSSEGVVHAGNLWLLTSKGISRFDPAAGRFWNFGPADGVAIAPSDWAHSCFKARNGTLYFGGTNGLVRFHPDSVKINRSIPPIVLSSFRVFNDEFPLDSATDAKKAIVLSYAENMISFAFAALNYVRPEKNQFAYKLEGVDRDWVYCGTRRTATYANLGPGSYVFRVKGSNNDGVWNEEGASILVVLTPPFWRTWWAYTLYGLFIVGLLFSLRRFEHSRLLLKHQVELRDVESKKLIEIDRVKSQFFANISHEFRTPLTLILGPLENVRSSITDESSQRSLQVIKGNAHRLLRLVNQLLDLSKLEAGALRLRASTTDIVPLARGITFAFESSAGLKHIGVRFVSDRSQIDVFVDRDLIEKILTNLLSNALKFTKEGGTVTVEVTEVRAQHSALTDQNYVRLSVTDTGIGISPDQLNKIFDRFYQVDASQTREHEGSGLGLALVKELVELHHGTILVQSQVGQGTTFTVRLPLGRSHLRDDEIVEPTSIEDSAVYEPAGEFVEPGISPDSPGGQPGETAGEKPIVLIVDDNADVRAFLRGHLESEFAILESENGRKAFQKSCEVMPDLVVSDVMMPDMDGIEFARAMKRDERTSHIPVILLTAKAGTENRIEGLESGADDYLTKPFEAKELLARVKNLIEQRRKLREKFSVGQVLKPGEIAVTSMDDVFLKKVMGAIESRMGDESYSVEQLGSDINMSRSQLLRKLTALTGQSPSDFIRYMRLHRAKGLLEKNAGTVSEIAYQVGFRGASYFTRCFRDQFGVLPSELKRRE